jgi:SAM-dependent methyltransferase
MSDRAAEFTGSIPAFYDHGLGPVFFTDFADHIARRATASAPMRVLEIAAGTGIVTRRLRDLLPPEAHLVATDLNPPMLEVARRKFRPDESVEFQPADAAALRFSDSSFDALVCEFGVMFFPDKDRSYREAHRVLGSGGRYLFSVWDSHRHNPIGRLITEILAGFFPHDPPQFYKVPFGYHSIDPIKKSLEVAEFTDLKVEVELEEDGSQCRDLCPSARARQPLGGPNTSTRRRRSGTGHRGPSWSNSARIRLRSGASLASGNRVRG